MTPKEKQAFATIQDMMDRKKLLSIHLSRWGKASHEAYVQYSGSSTATDCRAAALVDAVAESMHRKPLSGASVF